METAEAAVYTRPPAPPPPPQLIPPEPPAPTIKASTVPVLFVTVNVPLDVKV